MPLSVATILPALFLLILGGLLFSQNSGVVAMIKRFPRSRSAAYVLFGACAVWFLREVWHLSEADFGQYRAYLFVLFAAVAVLSFKLVPDFLSVRGAAGLVLLSASHLLRAAFMQYDSPQRLFMVGFVYVAIVAAIYLGAVPYRLRDFIEWLYRVPTRARVLGGVFLIYGALLSAVSFTY